MGPFLADGSLAGLPVLFKRLARHGWQVACAGPCGGGVETRAFDERMESLQEPPCPFGELINSGTRHHPGERFESQFLGAGRFLGGSIAPVVQEVMVQVDFYRAHLGAGAAEGTGERKMLPVLQASEVRGDD